MNGVMDNGALLEIIKKLLKTNTDLSFLLTLPEKHWWAAYGNESINWGNKTYEQIKFDIGIVKEKLGVTWKLTYNGS